MIENRFDRYDAPPRILAMELFRIDGEKLEQIKAHIERSNGLVLALVHPYYSKDFFWSEQQREQKKESLRTMRRIDAFIGSKSQSKPVVVIFEESHLMNETIDHLNRIAPTADILVTPTLISSSLPNLRDVRGHSEERIDRSWEPIRKALHYLGVKKIILGGMNLSKSGAEAQGRLPVSTPLSSRYTECVAGTWRALQNEFEVEISSFAYPNARRDVYAPREKREDEPW